MVKKILTYNSKKLREKSQPVKKLDKAVMRLVKDLVETLRCSGGVGLSAPQIGVLKRVFVYEYIKPKDSMDATPNIPLTILINPEITKVSKKLIADEEGCLSVPNVFGRIKRNEKITVRALGINGKIIEFATTGLEARIIQHEADHLDGVLFIDRLNNLDEAYTYSM